MSLELRIAHRAGDFALDVDIRAGDGVTALFGRSGSGKTTVVNAVAGLLAPGSGRIVLDGDVLLDTDRGIRVPPHRRRVGYVFQEARLFPHMTVRGNLLYGRRFAPDRAGTDEIDRIVALLGIGALLERRPGALSGGEAQRVAIGRALLSRPRLLLLDEPLASLDEPRRAEILPFLERVRDGAGLPMLYVSHSVVEVARLAQTVVVMEAGRVIRSGPAGAVIPDLGPRGAGGIRGAGAVITGRVARHHDDGLTEIAVARGSLFLPRVTAPPGSTLRVRIAAQDVTLSLDPPGRISALNVLPGTVADLRRGTGPGTLVRLDSGGDALLARVTSRSADRLSLAPGTPLWAMVKTVSVAPEDIGQDRGTALDGPSD